MVMEGNDFFLESLGVFGDGWNVDARVTANIPEKPG